MSKWIWFALEMVACVAFGMGTFMCVRRAFWWTVLRLWRRPDRTRIIWEGWWTPTLITQDPETVKELRFKPVLAGSMPAFYMSCANHGILDSSANWTHLKQIVHPFVREAGTAMVRLAEKNPIRHRDPDAEINVWDFIGAHVAQVSSQASGLPPVPFRSVWSKVMIFIFGSAFVGDVFRWIARALFSWTDYERRVLAALSDPSTPHLREALSQLGGSPDAFLGHAYGVSLGSTIPETTITSDIILELAKDPNLQEWVRQAAAKDGVEYSDFIMSRCYRYTFFPSGKVRRIGAWNFAVDYSDPQAGASPWGYGARKCPGAKFGQRLIQTVVRQLVSAYHIRSVEAPPKDLADRLFEFVGRVTGFEGSTMGIKYVWRGSLPAHNITLRPRGPVVSRPSRLHRSCSSPAA